MSSAPAAAAPAENLSPRLVTSVVAAGIMSFSGVVVETAMNVTFPTLMATFGVDTATVQWVTTGYLLVLSLMIPASSYLNRRFRLKSLFIAAVAFFFAGTLMAALSPSFGALLAGRLVQGLGTGLALPMMFNIILSQVPPKNRGVMMGVGMLITGVAPAIGPSLGGMLVSYVSWRAVFWVLMPLLAVSFVMGVATIRQVGEPQRCSFDLVGFIMLAVGFAAFIFGANMASSAGWLSGQVLGLFAVCVVAIALFCRHSLGADEPLLSVRVFSSPVYALSIVGMLMLQLTCLGVGFVIPNYAQLTLGTDAFTSGLLLVPGCILGAILAPLSGKVLDRMGAKPPLMAGSLAALLSMVLFFAFSGSLSVPAIIAFYVVFTFGQGNFLGTDMTNSIAHLDPAQAPDGNAVFNTVQQLAGAIGTALASTVVASAQAGSTDIAAGTAAGAQQAFLMTAAFCAVMVACTLAIIRLMRDE